MDGIRHDVFGIHRLLEGRRDALHRHRSSLTISIAGTFPVDLSGTKEAEQKKWNKRSETKMGFGSTSALKQLTWCGNACFSARAPKNISIQIKKFWYPAETVPFLASWPSE